MYLKKLIKEWLMPIGAAIIIVLLINKFLFYQITIPSPSMYPTIKVGDRIIVTRVYDKSKLKRGDIIVFDSKELKMTLIKRLIGLPDDEVEVKDGGAVYINGRKQQEPYVVNKDNLSESFKVPKGKYLFFGDNRPVSDDARRWQVKYIDSKDIKGKAQFVLFPFKRFGKFVVGQEALKH